MEIDRNNFRQVTQQQAFLVLKSIEQPISVVSDFPNTYWIDETGVIAYSQHGQFANEYYLLANDSALTLVTNIMNKY